MPVYEYECNICLKHFDVRRGFNDESIARCPECSGKAHRLFSAVPIIFNGSGFYVTDNRSNGAGTKKTQDTPPSAEAVHSEQ
jgi:putative FmdB family regulatory protein